MDNLDGWNGILVLVYLGAVALTLKLRPHWLLIPGADPVSLWWRARRARKAQAAGQRPPEDDNNTEAVHDGSEH